MLRHTCYVQMEIVASFSISRNKLRSFIFAREGRRKKFLKRKRTRNEEIKCFGPTGLVLDWAYFSWKPKIEPNRTKPKKFIFWFQLWFLYLRWSLFGFGFGFKTQPDRWTEKLIPSVACPATRRNPTISSVCSCLIFCGLTWVHKPFLSSFSYPWLRRRWR